MLLVIKQAEAFLADSLSLAESVHTACNRSSLVQHLQCFLERAGADHETNSQPRNAALFPSSLLNT